MFHWFGNIQILGCENLHFIMNSYQNISILKEFTKMNQSFHSKLFSSIFGCSNKKQSDHLLGRITFFSFIVHLFCLGLSVFMLDICKI